MKILYYILVAYGVYLFLQGLRHSTHAYEFLATVGLGMIFLVKVTQKRRSEKEDTSDE
mgnify:CR=1 FL=1